MSIEPEDPFSAPPQSFYLSLEGEHLGPDFLESLTVGQVIRVPLCAIPHRLNASFSPSRKFSRLGNSLHRMRGKVLHADADSWVLDVGFPVLCQTPLPSCFAPRKWLEGIFSLRLAQSLELPLFEERKGCETLLRSWKVLSLYRDDAFWSMVRGEDAPDAALSAQVVRALQYFESLGADTHWEKIQKVGPDCEDDSHYLVVLEPLIY
jgi:hypothetical protein